MEFEITNEFSLIALLAFGFVLGLKHAVEADHLAAVSTIVAEHKSLLSSAFVGGFWGVGHTISLLIVGAIVITLKLQIPPSLEAGLESIVGVMLVILGANALRKLLKRDKIHIHTHEHEGRKHIHVHAHDKKQPSRTHHMLRFSPRSIAIGMIHGLAGSAALMLLIVPAIASPAVGLLYIAVFGIGSIGGMMLMSVLIGLPMYFTAGRFNSLNKGILLSAGLFSCGLGIFIVYTKMA